MSAPEDDKSSRKLPLPRVVFIDTGIFDQHAYNFSAAAMMELANTAASKKLTLLLPDPTEREITRHIKNRSRAALKALEDARHSYPFVGKWKHWPSEKITDETQKDIEAIAQTELQDFLKSFRVQKLGYEGINIIQMMDWYDKKQAPFGEGKKRKEFPDAFALAAVVHYAKSNNTKVAVVAFDPDFQKACALHPELVFYDKLPELIEDFIAEDAQVETIKRVIESYPEPLQRKIGEDFTELAFHPEADPMGDVEGVSVEFVELMTTSIVEIDDTSCRVIFEARVHYSAYVSYDDASSAIIDSSEDIYIPLHTKAGTVTESTDITGSAYLVFDETWKEIFDVLDLEFEEQNIAVATEPPIYFDESNER